MDDISGQKFGRLTVLRFDGIRPGRRYHWWCQCECGTEKSVMRQNLTRGKIRSCGCLRNEASARTMRANADKFIGSRLRHGMTNSPTFASWNSMMQRCTNPRRDNYKFYGGRGIRVCKRWLTFENFLADMGVRPVGTTLDRINNNGNYTPTNCRWSTPKAQSNNRRPRSANNASQ